jgi:tetratricopeptide (TPR) repeat protein
MKTRLILVSLCLALASARAQSPADTLVTATERTVERAYLRASATDVAAAAKPLDAALAADPKNPARLYERAFAYYAELPSMRAANDKKAMIAKLEQAAAVLERVKGQPWEAEAAALHSGLLGQLIGLKGAMSGMMLGPKSGQLIARAEKALKDNPRVLLFRGISLLNTPSAFGGDPAKGTQMLQQSVDAFAKVEASAPGPHWGKVDALTWLGIAKQTAGDVAGARAAWEQVLALEPDDGWVKFALLPSLDQKKGK